MYNLCIDILSPAVVSNNSGTYYWFIWEWCCFHF